MAHLGDALRHLFLSSLARYSPLIKDFVADPGVKKLLDPGSATLFIGAALCTRSMTVVVLVDPDSFGSVNQNFDPGRAKCSHTRK